MRASRKISPAVLGLGRRCRWRSNLSRNAATTASVSVSPVTADSSRANRSASACLMFSAISTFYTRFFYLPMALYPAVFGSPGRTGTERPHRRYSKRWRDTTGSSRPESVNPWRQGTTYSRRLAPVDFGSLPIPVLRGIILRRKASKEIMRILLAVLVAESVIGAASAALKPIETDIHPVDNKAAAVYKTTPQGDLRINLYFPPKWNASDRRAAVVFFFAGSCATGSPAQFAATAEYFAVRGLVATAPEYRLESVHHTPPERCVEDGKSAIRWLRMNARYLGIDTRRVIAGGGSSGASIAAFTAYNTAFEPDDEDRSISPEPNALVLLNPAFGCPPGQSSQGAPCAVMASWKVTKGGPPAILFMPPNVLPRKSTSAPVAPGASVGPW